MKPAEKPAKRVTNREKEVKEAIRRRQLTIEQLGDLPGSLVDDLKKEIEFLTRFLIHRRSYGERPKWEEIKNFL